MAVTLARAVTLRSGVTAEDCVCGCGRRIAVVGPPRYCILRQTDGAAAVSAAPDAHACLAFARVVTDLRFQN